MIAATTVSPIGAGVFFRSMNRKIPHALDEHEGNTLGFDEVLIPGAAKQEVDQSRHVADVHLAVLVAVGSLRSSLAIQ